MLGTFSTNASSQAVKQIHPLYSRSCSARFDKAQPANVLFFKCPLYTYLPTYLPPIEYRRGLNGWRTRERSGQYGLDPASHMTYPRRSFVFPGFDRVPFVPFPSPRTELLVFKSARTEAAGSVLSPLFRYGRVSIYRIHELQFLKDQILSLFP